MGIFDRFPYSSTHEMNLDYMLGKATEIAEDMQTVATGMAQVQAGLSAISEKTEQATQAAAQAAQSASSIEGSVTAAEEAAEEAQMHNESAQTWANNALTYKADCQRSATEAAASSSSAAQAATAAAASEDTVAQYAQAANASAQSAANNNDSAHQYANQASASASNATFHSSNAQTAATNANTSATNAETAATNAQTAATRAATLKDDVETLHRMCVAAVDQAAHEAINAGNSAGQAAATKTDVENLVESLPEDFTDLNNTVNQLSDEIANHNILLKKIVAVVSQGVYATDQSANIAELLEIINLIPAQIPANYTRCYYLKSTGTQYIVTGYKPTANTKFVIDLAFSDTSNNQNNGVGSLGGANNRCVMGIGDSNNWYWGIGQNNLSGVAADTNRHRMYVDIRNGKYGIDTTENTITTNFTQHTVAVTSNLFSRAYYDNGAQNLCKEKLYFAEFYENDALVHQYVPCLDDSNIPCLYDTVSGNTLYNAGTGTFEYMEVQ